MECEYVWVGMVVGSLRVKYGWNRWGMHILVGAMTICAEGKGVLDALLRDLNVLGIVRTRKIAETKLIPKDSLSRTLRDL